jgi:acetylornithine aminotransferase
VLPSEFLLELRQICDAQGWLLMLDEVQTGIGRTGAWFGFQHSGILPDVMALAKGLGSGVPIGACLARGAAANVFQPGNHGSTFGGNPLACAAALATLDAIEEEKLIDNARVRGEAIRSGLRQALAGVHGVIDIRGEGLMIGIELDRPCGELVAVAREAGVLINVTADSVIRLVPPLIYGAAEADALVTAVSGIVKNYLQQAA